MAITKNTLTPITSGFGVNATTADASGCEELVAAPASGSLVLTQVVINTVAAITVTIGESEDAGAVETVIIGPVNFAATAGAPAAYKFDPPIKLTAAKSLTVDASGAGAVQVFAQGYYD